MNGIFVTFEGIEGCGKSTQLSLLANWLSGSGLEVVVTREPGGTAIGERIRSILQTGDGSSIFSARTEILLFEASRAQHVEEKILPALETGKIVLCDRFFDSTVVYQGSARQIEADTVKFLNAFASHGCSPDMTIFIDIGVATSFKRIAARNGSRDRIELENELFFSKVRDGYLDLVRGDGRFFAVDGNVDAETVHAQIRDEFTKRFFKN
ncbi:MAG: dTMP kinase [Puniceicoccales bacterium]|jgi:dTMP kinase|nr:dTMP kinase [Puniceicoccales bacterium]